VTFSRKNHSRCVKIGLTLKKQLFNKKSQNVLKLAHGLKKYPADWNRLPGAFRQRNALLKYRESRELPESPHKKAHREQRQQRKPLHRRPMFRPQESN
jgi:hypothetical protein